MIQGSKSSDVEGAEGAGSLVTWREYAGIPRFEDYDDLVGDELSVPIIYEPL